GGTVEVAMKLADKFGMKHVLFDAEIYLIRDRNKVEKGLKLLLATRYNLLTLMEHCMSKLIDKNSISSVKMSDYYDDLPSVIKEVLFDKLIKVAR
ncbi:hypothetical protein PENTCL1PPCAC_23290, partial [Pristionchus entomophagus]